MFANEAVEGKTASERLRCEDKQHVVCFLLEAHLFFRSWVFNSLNKDGAIDLDLWVYIASDKRFFPSSMCPLSTCWFGTPKFKMLLPYLDRWKHIGVLSILPSPSHLTPINK